MQLTIGFLSASLLQAEVLSSKEMGVGGKERFGENSKAWIEKTPGKTLFQIRKQSELESPGFPV